MVLTLILMLPLSQTQPAAKPAQQTQKIEIIRGSPKKKAAKAGSDDTSQADALAAKEKDLAAKQAALDEKNAQLDAKTQALEAKQKAIEEREEAAKAEREADEKRAADRQKAADGYARDTNSAMTDMGNALGGN